MTFYNMARQMELDRVQRIIDRYLPDYMEVISLKWQAVQEIVANKCSQEEQALFREEHRYFKKRY